MGVVIVNIIQLKPSDVPRPGRNRPGYLVMKASMQERGIVTPLLVYPEADGKYDIVDGMERYTAALELGMLEVPIQIVQRD